jgi:hypothetical protein
LWYFEILLQLREKMSPGLTGRHPLEAFMNLVRGPESIFKLPFGRERGRAGLQVENSTAPLYCSYSFSYLAEELGKST